MFSQISQQPTVGNSSTHEGRLTTSAKVCGGPCGPGRTSMFQLFPVVKGLTPSSRGEGAAALRLDKLTSSNSMFSYVLSYNYLITAIYRSKQIDGFLLCIIYSGLISPNPPRFKFPRFSSLYQAVSQVALLTACHFAESRDHIRYYTDPSPYSC